jgi:hypothetical protein
MCSCSGINRIKIENEKKILIFKGSGSIPVIEIDYQGDPGKIAYYSSFADKALTSFYPYVKNDFSRTFRISYSDDYYRLFYSIGVHMLSDWKNDLLKYGIIEIEWEKLLYKFKNQFRDIDPADEYGRFFRIGEIDDLLRTRLPSKDFDQIYPFTVRFHIKEITFISIQEFYSRQARYYSPDYIENPFTRMIVIPESVEFTRYILNRFGKTRLLLLSSTEYTSDNWKNLTDEKISETELDFSRRMENYPFYGTFTDTMFTNELYSILKIYNKNTKQTLFRK